MNKLLTKIAGGLLGLSLAVGVGVAFNNNKAIKVNADAAYTLQTPKNDSNTDYNSNYDVTVSSVVWSIPGNQGTAGQMKIGGGKKSAIGERIIYSKGALEHNIGSIKMNFGSESGAIVVTGISVSVYSTAANAAAGTNAEESKNFTYTASGNSTVSPTSGTWNNKYYRFDFDVSVANTGSNVYMTVTSIEFITSSGGGQQGGGGEQGGGGGLSDSLILQPNVFSFDNSGTTVEFANTSSSGTNIVGSKTLSGTDGNTYVINATTKAYCGSANISTSEEAFDSTGKVILWGKTNSVFYNTTAYDKKIAKLEVFVPTGASANVRMIAAFDDDNAVTDIPNTTTSSGTLLSTLDHVYDFSGAGMLNNDYRYFCLKITNNYNAQMQVKITFAEENQQATALNSITLSHADIDANDKLPIPVGGSKTLTVTYDPSNDDTVDKSIAWSTSDASVANVNSGTITIEKTASIGDEATITATPNDTNAEAKSIVVRAVAPVVKTVDMRNGFTNDKTENRLQVNAGQGLSMWPSNAIKVTLTDDSVIYPNWNDENITWYYVNSDDNSNDVTINDPLTFAFASGMKRMRLSYSGVMCQSRTYINVDTTAAYFAQLILLISCDNGVTAPDTDDWDDLKGYWNDGTTISSVGKAYLQGAIAANKDTALPASPTDADYIACGLARYDYIVGKYNKKLGLTTEYPDFMLRNPATVGGENTLIKGFNSEANNPIALIVIVSMTSVGAIAGYFFIRKRRVI